MRPIIQDGKDTIIVDIDGTLSIPKPERLELLKQEQPDWDTFYKLCFDDEAHHDIIELVAFYYCAGYKVVFCTSRRRSVYELTKEWLIKQFNNWELDFGDELMENSQLLMRNDKDWRHDTEVKPHLLEKAGIPLESIKFVLEDRNSMVKKWRELGLRVLHVAEGEF